MRILIDLTSLADNFSGLERYALNISKNLLLQDKNNDYIVLFKNEVHKEFKRFLNENSIETVVIKGGNKLVFNQIILPYYLYKIKADRYLFLAFPSPLFFRKKGIYNTIHDLTAFLYPSTMKLQSMLYFKYSIINAVRVSEKIITVSNSSKKDILKKFGQINVDVITNGVSEVFTKYVYDEDIDNVIKEKYNLPDKYIMSLGTLEPRKNLMLLIKAFTELKRENKIDSKLVLVGRKGWKMDEVLESLSEEGLTNEIIFTGFVEDEHLPYIYINAGLFIFPSIYEGFGIPPLEAMYMKTKVLASDIDVLKEILGKECTYFKNNSLNDLKKKILLLENIYTENNHVYGKKRAEGFSWQVEALKCLNILK